MANAAIVGSLIVLAVLAIVAVRAEQRRARVPANTSRTAGTRVRLLPHHQDENGNGTERRAG